MIKKKVFYTELSYLLGLVIMAFAAAFTEKANFGMSMVVAPAYILHLKVSTFLPWFSFGVAEYCFQGILIIVTAVLMKKFKRSHLYDINFQAEEMFDALIKHFKQAEGITEQLKSDNQMEWVARMNNIRQRAAEIVNDNIIYN